MSVSAADPRAFTERTPARSRYVAMLARRFAMSTWFLVALLAAWELRARNAPSLFVPPPTTILDRCRDVWLGGAWNQLFLSDAFWDNVTPSLTRMVRGWGIAVVCGVTIGAVLGTWHRAEMLASPVVRFGMATPSVLFLPLAIAVLGINDSMNVFVIALGSSWAVLVNTIDGVRGIDRVGVLSARSLQLSRFATFRYVTLPGAGPQIFAGLRVSLGVAFILMVSSELYAARDGVGQYIVTSQQNFRFTDMWTGIFLVAILGIIVNLAFARLERRVLRWHVEARARR